MTTAHAERAALPMKRPPMAERYRQAKRGAWVGLTANTALGGLKVTLGLVAGSVAVISDGLHSFSDTVSSLILLLGLRKAEQPPDAGHPFGHHKAEPLAARLMAVLLVLLAAGMIWHALGHLLRPTAPAPPETLALWACIISLVAKEAMFQYKIRVAHRTLSEAVRTDAWHHRSDAFSSLVALIGVAAARFGGASWTAADPIAGIGIALVVGGVGLRAFVRTTHDLMDAVPYPGIDQEIHRLAREVPGVVHTDDANVRKAGMRLFAELHVEVDPDITVRAGHDIASAVRDHVLEAFPEMATVIVHVEPRFPDAPPSEADPPA